VLLKALMDKPVEKLIVASSMSVYGEGLYRSRDGRIVSGAVRSLAQLRSGDWELHDEDGSVLEPIPTPETKQPELASIYALSKFDQERMCLITGAAYGIPAVALRFWNAYGTRQALSNPYTGVLAIFASRFLNDKPPVIFEDGLQRRDFVSVRDIARACRLALENRSADGEVFNIASGEPMTVREVVAEMARVLGKEYLTPVVSGKYRMGDIRHCFPDISKAVEVLGYSPEVRFGDGLVELAQWLGQQHAEDRIDSANAELDRRGLRI
jgi:dTDP-L-rhamnose 4-epimerase